MERLKHLTEANIVLGAWLIAAPFVLGYTSSQMQLANDLALGALLILCSWWMLASAVGQIEAGGIQFLGGLWLIVAPFVGHYAHFSRPFSNDIIVGILAALASAVTTWMFASRVRKTV